MTSFFNFKGLKHLGTAAFALTLPLQFMPPLEAMHNGGDKEQTTSSVPSLKSIRKAARHDQVSAQLELGQMYEKGNRVSKDELKALKWYKRAAKNESEAGLDNFKRLYESLHRTWKAEPYPRREEVQNVRASKYARSYQLAAKLGDSDAQNSFGTYCKAGVGVPQNISKAIKWFERSAAQGNSAGQYSLGNMYEYGNEVPRDIDKAIELYTLSAEQGHPLAQYDLGEIYHIGDLYRTEYNGKIVPQNLPEAFKWFKRAAKQGGSNAQYSIGKMYERGESAPPMA